MTHSAGPWRRRRRRRRLLGGMCPPGGDHLGHTPTRGGMCQTAQYVACVDSALVLLAGVRGLLLRMGW
ncbi:hypothetical protein E2C01_012924 [Portunus trituberculatus]|uniref:Uncharacterized protein n=1 Tax=Portunus trituberculatus TaxID=210409 RepID=A0A5B7DFH1_PORTR|nr:hypothetical protein [Portunus trituberculatus]